MFSAVEISNFEIFKILQLFYYNKMTKIILLL